MYNTQNDIQLINSKLDEYLKEKYPQKIWDAMRYSIFAGGKRLRPLMVLEAARICDGDIESVLPVACALEMIHTYSLIHDDLPCMDNDDYRRGNLTNHKVYGEGMAVLAGDALLSYAPLVILQNTPKTVNSEVLLKVLEEFYLAIGLTGMLSGQVVDILSENKKIDEKTFHYIHTHKTGALFEFALKSGAMLSNASADKLNALIKYGQLIGYAFQIADDILDIIADFDSMGKTPHKDANANKNTHPSFYGLENSYKELNSLCLEAKNILQLNNIKSELLVDIANELVDKVKEK